MFYRRLLIVLPLYFLSVHTVPLHAENLSNLAINDFQPEGIDSSTARLISDRIRSELFRIGAFNVIERNEMYQILREQGFQQTGCVSDQCIVEVGKLLGVFKIIAGTIGKVGDTYTINARVIDVTTGKIENFVNVDCRCPIDDVLSKSTTQIAIKLSGFTSQQTHQTNTTSLTAESARKTPEKMKWIPMGEFDGFFIDENEVTQNDYLKVMGNNPSQHENCKKCPVEEVKWIDAKHYCERTGKQLPTITEWMTAAVLSTGDNRESNKLDVLLKSGWFKQNSGKSTHIVKQKQANSFGLYDMLGNVAEWCSDNFIETSTNSWGGIVNYRRAYYIGGSYSDAVDNKHIYEPEDMEVDDERRNIGFRCVME